MNKILLPIPPTNNEGDGDGIDDNSSENNLSLENEEEDGNNELGLLMDARTTTFRDLKGMIPRGFGISDSLSKKEGIKQYEDSNTVTASNSGSSALEAMKNRNKAKWESLGFDPNAGQGNMKMSVTFANFNPTAIMHGLNKAKAATGSSSNKTENSKQTNLEITKDNNNNNKSAEQAQSQDNFETKSSVPLQVLQSYSMCIKPPKKIKKVNSFSDTKNISNPKSSDDDVDDQNKFKNQLNTDALLAPVEYQPEENVVTQQWSQILKASGTEIKEEESPVIKAQNMTASHLLNNFSIDTNSKEEEENHDEYEYEIVEEEEEEDTHEDKAVEEQSKSQPQQPETNSIENDRRVSTPIENSIDNQNSENNSIRTPNSNSRNIDNKIEHDSNSFESETADQDMLNSPFETTSLTISKSNNSSQIQQAPVGYDYSAYDDPNFDYESASKVVPPDLLDLIKFPKTGIVFRSICGESMVEYPKGIVQCVISDLKVIQNQCVSRNMIYETAFVNDRVESIREEMASISPYNQQQILKVKQAKLNESKQITEDALDRKNQYWQTQKAIFVSEKELKLQEVELRHQDELKNLEELWQSDKMREQFSKPSAQLIALRQNIQKHLQVKEFEKAAQLANEAEQMDRYETQQAVQRMKAAYNDAIEKLEQKFKSEKEAVLQQFEAKQCSLTSKQGNDVKPLENRLHKYAVMESNLLNQQQPLNQTRKSYASMQSKIPKSAMHIRSSGSILKRPLITAPKMPANTNAKLKLPPLKQ